VVVGDVGEAVDAAAVVAFGFGSSAAVVAPGRRWRDATLIGARGIVVALSATLGKSGNREGNGDENRQGTRDE
jgi:hypothetical protein